MLGGRSLEGSKEEGSTSRTENTKRPNAKYRARLVFRGRRMGPLEGRREGEGIPAEGRRRRQKGRWAVGRM